MKTTVIVGDPRSYQGMLHTIVSFSFFAERADLQVLGQRGAEVVTVKVTSRVHMRQFDSLTALHRVTEKNKHNLCITSNILIKAALH